MNLWKALFITYGSYFFIYVLSIFLVGTDIFSIFILLGHLIAVASLCLFYRDEKPKINIIIRTGIVVFYSIFLVVNSAVFLIILFSNPGSFFGAMPISLIDLLPFPLSIISLYPVFKTFTNFKFEGSKFNRYFWISYFWFFNCLLVVTLIIMVPEIQRWTPYDYVTFLSLPLSFLPLFMFIYKKQIFSSLFWQVYFWISIVWTIYEFLYSAEPIKQLISVPPAFKSFNTEPIPFLFWAIFIPLFIPSYYAFYKIAFDKNFFKKNN